VYVLLVYGTTCIVWRSCGVEVAAVQFGNKDVGSDPGIKDSDRPATF
jgi:hypothetical protein